jgi:hypothetical protein
MLLLTGHLQSRSSPFFVRHGSHCCRVDLFGRTIFWVFLSGLKKLGQRAKNFIELRGECLELIPSLVAVACFVPGRAKDLSAPTLYRCLWFKWWYL